MNEELLFNRYSVSVEEDEKFLEVDGGDGAHRMNVFNATDLYT